jgi:NAD(P)H dehydrogenase (quinone)
MNNKPVILIAGACGNIGLPIVRNLLAMPNRNGYIIRLGAHNRQKVKEFEGKQGVEIVDLDFENKDLCMRALKGVDRLWVTEPNPTKTMKMYDRARLVERFLDCVREVGTVKFILFGSVAGAETESTTFGKEFRMVEKKIEGLGISWCFLRMAMFLENIIALREELNQGQLPEHMNTGRFAPLSIEDVGVSVATILLNPDAHRNKAYLLTGPEALTGEQQAQVLSKVLNRQIKYVDIDKQRALNMWKGSMPEYQAEGMFELFDLVSKNVLKDPSPAFKQITGKDGTRFEAGIQRLRERGMLSTTTA